MGSTTARIGMVHKGAYDPATEYQLLDVVEDGGSSYAYIALAPAVGKPLPVAPETKTTHWALVASRGENVELRRDGGTLQWRTEHGEWDDLVSLVDITGPQGESITGPQGEAATITIGEVTTVDPDAEASVINVGTAGDAILKIAVPRGKTGVTGATGPSIEMGVDDEYIYWRVTGSDEWIQLIALADLTGSIGPQGPAATIQIGSVTTGAPGTEASVTNSGTEGAAVLDIVIPAGRDGTGSGDMSKSLYDTDGDGQVNAADDSDRLGGELPAHYATKADLTGKLDATATAADAAKLGGKLPTDYATAAQGTKADDALPATGKAADAALLNGQDASYYAKASDLTGKASTATYTATIPATGWTGSAAPYSLATVSVLPAGLLATDTPIVDIVQTGTEATDSVMRDNWGKITRITTKAGAISVYASEIPTAAIQIQLKVVR